MKATLLTHMGDDLMVVNAARVSFAKKSQYLYEMVECPVRDSGYMEVPYVSDGDKKLLGYLAKHGHWTPFAHPQIQFHMKVPIFVANQLKRHQIGLALNEVSRRYVDDEPEFYWPDEWRLRAENKKQGSSDEAVSLNRFNSQGHRLGDRDVAAITFDDTLFDYVTEAKGLYNLMLGRMNIAPEMARMILPQNMYTEWYWTGSLAAFARICKQRLNSHAQSETREVAQQMSDQIEPLFPVSWEALIKGDEE